MKKLLLAILILLTPAFSFADRIWEERFEASPGYDESWSEAEFTVLGGTINEDKATSELSGSWPNNHDDCLEIAFTDNQYPYRAHIFSADMPIYYMRVYLRIDSATNSLTDGERNMFFSATAKASSNQICYSVGYENDGGDMKACIAPYVDGTPPGDVVLSNKILEEDKWYMIEVKWDVTNSLWDWRIDLEAQPVSGVGDDGVLSGSPYSVGRQLAGSVINAYGNCQTSTHYLDNLMGDDEDWCGIEPIDLTGIIRVGLLADTHYQATAGAINRCQDIKDYIEWFNAMEVDAVIIVGDVLLFWADPPGNLSAYETCISDGGPKFVMLFLPGNHDVYSGGNEDENLSDWCVGASYLPLQDLTLTATDTQRGNSVINIGETVQFILFQNMNTVDAVAEYAHSETITWLGNRLVESDARGRKVRLATHGMIAHDWPGNPPIWRTNPGQGGGITFDSQEASGESVTFSYTGSVLGATDVDRKLYFTFHSGEGAINGDNVDWCSGTITAINTGTKTGSMTVIASMDSSGAIVDHVVSDQINTYQSAYSRSAEDIQDAIDDYADIIVSSFSGHTHNGYAIGTRVRTYGSDTISFHNLHSTWEGYGGSAYDVGGRYILEIAADGETETLTSYPLGGYNNRNGNTGEGIAFYDSSGDATRYYGTLAQMVRAEESVYDGIDPDDIVSGQMHRFSLGGMFTVPSSGTSGHPIVFKLFRFDTTMFISEECVDFDSQDYILFKNCKFFSNASPAYLNLDGVGSAISNTSGTSALSRILFNIPTF